MPPSQHAIILGGWKAALLLARTPVQFKFMYSMKLAEVRLGHESSWLPAAPEWLVVVVLILSGVVLPTTFWYFANRPNVTVRRVLEAQVATIEVVNEGRSKVRSVWIRCANLTVDEAPDSPAVQLNHQLGDLHPGQAIRFGVGFLADRRDKSGQYWITVRHCPYLLGRTRLRMSKRVFPIAFSTYVTGTYVAKRWQKKTDLP